MIHHRKNPLFTFDLYLGVNVAQYPSQHVTYAPAKFEVATPIGLRGYAFTRNTLFDLNLGVNVTKMMPSTLYVM